MIPGFLQVIAGLPELLSTSRAAAGAFSQGRKRQAVLWAGDIPRVLDVLAAIHSNFSVARAFMRRSLTRQTALRRSCNSSPPWPAFLSNSGLPSTSKKRVPHATGSIRTGGAIQYAHLVLGVRLGWSQNSYKSVYNNDTFIVYFPLQRVDKALRSRTDPGSDLQPVHFACLCLVRSLGGREE